MTFSYVTPFLQGMLQQESGKFLDHTYTKQSRTPVSGTTDDWGQPVYTYPSPVEGLVCYYIPNARPVHQPYGVISANKPTLFVPATDDLQDGDYVSNVATRGVPSLGIPPVILMAGPVLVETSAEQAANIGGSIYRQFNLIQIEVVPTDHPG